MGRIYKINSQDDEILIARKKQLRNLEYRLMAYNNVDRLLNDEPRVLAIQSHVVSGYCGNKSAVFPLQTLGFEVDFINSVQFSNHTGYGNWTGQVLNENDLLDLYKGLKQNDLHRHYTHIITGYCRSASFVEAILKVVQDIKIISPNAVYICDPVLGDHGRMYVPEELIPAYKSLIKVADIVCPNQFEAEMLTGVKIVDLNSATMAIDCMHEMGIKTVVISSTELSFGPQNELVVLASSLVPAPDICGLRGQRQYYRITIPRVNANFIGTGDLFSALFVAWFTKTKFNLKQTLEHVVATMYSVIHNTYDYALERGPGALAKWANIELKIIQSREDIIKPNVKILAYLINVPPSK